MTPAAGDPPGPKFSDLTYPDDRWWCRTAGVWVQKDLLANLAQRRRADELAQDPARRAAILDWCKRDFLFFCNLFLWTFKLFRHGQDGKVLETDSYVPFITWPIQDSAAKVKIRSTGIFGHAMFHMCDDKSREMGVSWLNLAIMLWVWRFYDGKSMLIVSRKEEEVDFSGVRPAPDSQVIPGDPDTLFWKLDCMFHFLPEWMKPRYSRTWMNFINLDNGSIINGESTNSDVARGGRRHIIMPDEAAAIDKLAAIERSVTDAAGTVWWVSTPVAGSHYSEMATSGRYHVNTFGWWDHPEKGALGREMKYDPDFGRVVVDGPWRQQEKKYRTPADIAANVDIDHKSAGVLMFSPNTLNLLAMTCRPPTRAVRLIRRRGGVEGLVHLAHKRMEAVRVESAADPNAPGVWRLWVPLVTRANKPTRADPDDTYIIASDIGMGDGASNSVAVVYSVLHRAIVADFISASISPRAFAAQVAMAGYLFGGRRGFAFLGWEANGPGKSYKRMLERLKYPWLLQDRETGSEAEAEQQRLGWTNTRERKREGLIELAEAYQAGELVEVDIKAIDEARGYIRYPSGGCGPKTLVNESPDAQATHGDRIMARVVLVFAARQVEVQLPDRRLAPVGTLAHELGEDTDDQEAEEY